MLASAVAAPFTAKAAKQPEVLPLVRRAQSALRLRQQTALTQNKRPTAPMTANADQTGLPNFIACFTKGLPQNQFAEVDPRAYRALLSAISSGKHADFERIPKGAARKLNNPEAAFAFHLEGGDSHSFAIPPAPSLKSAEAAAEMAELYWQALCRDIPFAEYHMSPLVLEAARDLGATHQTIFRGTTHGDLRGPYISQFLLRPIPYGSGKIEQRFNVPVPRSDFMTTVAEWSQIQAGVPPWREASFASTPRHIINGRDLAEFVHYDYSFQAYLNAALILFDNGPHTILNCNPFRSFANIYRNSIIQDGFVTFGQAEVMDWLGRVSSAALKAAYCQKWMVHRRLRPEALGGLIHQTKTGIRPYPLHPALLSSQAVEAIFDHSGSYLLPQCYPEGCPLHPSYPAGHAAIAGACSVVLKACFEESMLLPGSVIPNADGSALLPLAGFAPRIGDEINKLAFNISMGRNWAGIHYCSDATAGLRLGEDVAISILQDLVYTYSENFKGFSFTRFDGTKVHVSPKAEVTTA
jgi:hypothetical protein